MMPIFIYQWLKRWVSYTIWSIGPTPDLFNLLISQLINSAVSWGRIEEFLPAFCGMDVWKVLVYSWAQCGTKRIFGVLIVWRWSRAWKPKVVNRNDSVTRQFFVDLKLFERLMAFLMMPVSWLQEGFFKLLLGKVMARLHVFVMKQDEGLLFRLHLSSRHLFHLHLWLFQVA